MLIPPRRWEQIVNIKTKRYSPISVLRWTLIRHVIQSINKIEDDQTKKQILRQEMIWLNQYWAQANPFQDILPKYWTRLFDTKSLTVRRDLYE